MRRPDPVPTALEGRAVGVREALRFTTAGRLRGPGYARLSPGVVVARGFEVPARERIRGLRTVLPPEAVLGGWSAALALGVPWAGPEADVVEVVVAPQRRLSRRGVRVRRERLLGEDVVRTALGPATSCARTAFDLARRPPLDAAVAAVDAVLRAGGRTVADVEAVARAHAGVRGARHVPDVLALADPRAESPRESLLRVVLARAGLPTPVPQHEVLDDDGRFVARLDLAWPQLKVAVEYEGDHHRDRGQFAADLRRQNRLRALGWTVIQVDATQFRRPDLVVALLRSVLGR